MSLYSISSGRTLKTASNNIQKLCWKAGVSIKFYRNCEKGQCVSMGLRCVWMDLQFVVTGLQRVLIDLQYDWMGLHFVWICLQWTICSAASQPTLRFVNLSLFFTLCSTISKSFQVQISLDLNLMHLVPLSLFLNYSISRSQENSEW